MFRRLSIAAALVAGASLYVMAAERATFVLTNGERKSGEVVFHGGQSRNMIDEQLNLGNDGKEESIPFDRVAVIDFGGDPNANEARALPGDDLHLMVLRNGQTERGHFVNMVRGDTLQWRNQSGQERDIPIREVARVYLKPSVARNVFLGNVPGGGSAIGTGGGDGPMSATVQVRADRDWNETGMNVRQGERVAFRTTGQIRFSKDREHSAGPSGNRDVRNPTVPVPNVPVGALIARIGDGEPFPIAAAQQVITMNGDGPLMLGVNDNQWDDNTGSFNVMIRRENSNR
jgi:hypothetical protein